MTLVTRDATDGRWYPASAAECTSWLAGRTVAVPNPVSGWDFQAAAGNLTDFIGAITLTSFNAPQFHQVVAGHSRFAIGYTNNLDCHYAVTPSNGVGDITNSSTTVFGVVARSAAPTLAKDILKLGSPGINGRSTQTTTTPAFQVQGTGQATGTGAANAGTIARPFIFEVNRAGAAIVVQTDQETIAPAYTAPAGGSAYISFGPDSVGDSTTQVLWFFALAWQGVNAELNATQRATIIDANVNGPAVSSIAITPTSFTIAPLATQQMVATATRADGSTYDCSATATWLSSAPAVATVSATGLVTGVAAGTANITASFTSFNAPTATSPAQVATVAGGGVTPPQNIPGKVSSIVIGTPGIGFVQ